MDTPSPLAFQEAVDRARKSDFPSLPKYDSNTHQAELYGLYKQATEGDCTDPCPSAFQVVRRVKFDAWTTRKGMSRNEAQQSYIDLISAIDPSFQPSTRSESTASSAQSSESTNQVQEADASGGELPAQVRFECGPFTEAENQVIQKMKLVVGEDVIEKAGESAILVRHVRGQRKKTPAEIAMNIKNVLAWRAKNRIDDLLNENVDRHEIYHRCWLTNFCGNDKYGHPVLLERVEDHDVSQLVETLPIEDILIMRSQVLEALTRKCMESSELQQRRVFQFVWIFDLQGFDLNKHFWKAQPLLKALAELGNTKYVETVHKVFVVRAPLYFRTAWALAKIWVEPSTIQKIRFPDTLDQMYSEIEVLGVPVKQLPPQIGGQTPPQPAIEMIKGFSTGAANVRHNSVQVDATQEKKQGMVAYTLSALIHILRFFVILVIRVLAVLMLLAFIFVAVRTKVVFKFDES